jgi:cell division protein FtsW
MDDGIVDRWIFYTVLGLMAFGIIMVYSSSAFYAHRLHGDHLYYLKRQLIWVFLGIVLIFITYKFPYEKLNGWSFGFILISIGLLLYLLIKVKGRWIHLGPVNIQGADIARISMIIFLADSLSRKEQLLKDLGTGFLPHMVYILILAGLIVKQPDFSSAAMLVLIGLMILYISPLPLRFFSWPVLIVGFIAGAVIYFSPYKVDRINAYLNPEQDILGKGYQINQSLISLGSGGVTGVGFAQSNQKLFFLPEAHTDFIFAIIGEEWGLFGTVFILVLFFILLWRGIAVTRRTHDKFSYYLAFGLTINLVIYGLINMMVVTHLVPPTGLPLPFISYGGSSMLISSISVGLLLNISSKTYSPRKINNINFANRARQNLITRKRNFI